MCIGLTTGTVFLAAQALWRAKGLLPPIVSLSLSKAKNILDTEFPLPGDPRHRQ